MEEYKCCEECNKNITELHHIALRSQASYMANLVYQAVYEENKKSLSLEWCESHGTLIK